MWFWHIEKKTDVQKIEISSVVLFRRLKDAAPSGESTRKKDIRTIFRMMYTMCILGGVVALKAVQK